MYIPIYIYVYNIFQVNHEMDKTTPSYIDEECFIQHETLTKTFWKLSIGVSGVTLPRKPHKHKLLHKLIAVTLYTRTHMTAICNKQLHENTLAWNHMHIRNLAANGTPTMECTYDDIFKNHLCYCPWSIQHPSSIVWSARQCFRSDPWPNGCDADS